MERVQVYREQFELLTGPFRDWPDLPCLICKLGALEPTVAEFEGKQSKDRRIGSDTWDGRKNGFFHGELACSRTMCGNKYAVAGEWTEGPDEEANRDFDEADPHLIGLIIKHILPPLPLILLPETTPDKVKVLVESASSVLLSDPSAASTRIRIAIEAVLDEQRVRKTDPRGRSIRLTAHRRIELFQSRNKAAADQLMAMKWIGNVGSHEAAPLPLGFVLDGIELFARAVELVYDPREAELERRAAQINKQGRKLKADRLPKDRN